MPLKLNGSTSGYVIVDAPAVAGTNTLTLPASTGTVLTSSGGTLTIPTVNSGTSTALTLQSSNTTAMTIDTSQNVGIGTTSPGCKLDISGGALGTTTGNQVLLQRLNTTTTNGDILEITKTRTSAGSDWQSAGYRLQQKVDATWMGYIQLNGDNNNGGISFGTGTSTTSAVSISERMRIDSSGRVTIPYQPCFSVNKTTSTTSTGTIVYDSVRFNVGSHYSTSTGRFTAPVTGKYLFTIYGVPTNQNTINLVMQKNGGGAYNIWINNGNVGGDTSTSVTGIFDLAAGDYVNGYLNAGQMRQSNGDNNGFYGYLIG